MPINNFQNATVINFDPATPDMSVCNGGRRPAPGLPLEVFGPWQDWIKLQGEACSAPADYVAMALLITTSSLIGNSRVLPPYNWTRI